MIRKEEIEKAISQAEESFKCCWSKLQTLRANAADPLALRDAFVTFQPELAISLFKLEHNYQKVCSEARELISRRDKLDRKWVRKRLHTLNGLKHLLNRTADVGKALGDGFAWIFYQDETELLIRHYEHEANPHPPIGIGGRGEIEFIKRCPSFGQYLVIAHYNTTFLRIGDFSFFDADTGIAAFGELKSCPAGEGKMDLRMTMVGKGIPKHRLPTFQPTSGRPFTEGNPLPPLLEERLKRQISRMHDSFKPRPIDKVVGHSRIEAQFRHEALAQLHRQCSGQECSCLKADRGLAVVGIRRTGATIYKRLTENIAAKRMFSASGALDVTKGIIDKSIPDGSIRIDWLHYPARGRYSLQRGMRPLIWWNAPPAVIEAILFKHLLVMTLFNPAFMIRDLRAAGVDVTCDREGHFQVEKKLGDKVFEVKGLGYFLDLVQSQLFSDLGAVEMIRHMVESSIAAKFDRPTTVYLNPQFEY